MQFFKISDLAGSLLLCGLFSCGQWGLLYSCGIQASSCGSFSCYRAQDLRRMGFSSCGSQTLEHRLSSCGTWSQLLLTNQGLNLCLPHWQAGSSPLSYQGSPVEVQLIYNVLISAIQQSDSLRHTHIYNSFSYFFHHSLSQDIDIVLCAIQKDCVVLSILCIVIVSANCKLPIHPSLLPLATTGLFSVL